MCLEVYAVDRQIAIPYAHEVVRFRSATEYRTRYAFLLRNLGTTPLNTFHLLYPRCLFELPIHGRSDDSALDCAICGLTDISDRLDQDLSIFMETRRPNTMRVLLPDNQDPSVTLRDPEFEGHLVKEKVHWLTTGLSIGQGCLLESIDYTAWQVRLDTPIKPQTGRWFWWQIDVANVGAVLPHSMYGPVVYHVFASPIDVRRTFAEKLRSARTLCGMVPENFAETARSYPNSIDQLETAFGMFAPRLVNNRFYQLTIEIGRPERQFPIYCEVQGNIRQLPNSPRVGTSPKYDAWRLGELLMEWKWGSIVTPDFPWEDFGFTIRLGLSTKQKFSHAAYHAKRSPRRPTGRS